MNIFIIITSIIIIGIFFIIYFGRKNNKDKTYIKSFDIGPYKDALLSLKEGYLNHKKLLNWQSKYQDIYSTAKNGNALQIYKKYKYIQELAILGEFIEYIENGERATKQYNEIFVATQKNEYKSFFDKDVERYPLNDQQREAIIHDEDYNLVVAGAGTGKTTTIVGKALHLVKNQGVDPNNILLISFTKKAVGEMEERLKEKGIGLENIKTFHGLGYDVLGNAIGKKTPLDPEKDEKEEILQGIFDSLLSDEKYSQTLYEYFSYYLEYYKSSDNFDSEENYYKYFQDTGKKFKALDGNIVKSPDELNIANFLYIHGIPYEYEKSYEHKTETKEHKQYQPDFYLPDYGVYLEHFSLNEDGKSSYFGAEYMDGVIRKRKLHIGHKTQLLETYSWEFKKKHIPQLLKEKLEGLGVIIKPKALNEIIEELQKQDDYNKFSGFVKLLGTCISLLKSNQYSIEEVNEKAKDIRDIKFLEILDIAYKKYTEKLNEIDKIDFDDMISEATRHMKENSIQHNYDYILVDEFQDISAGRYKLLKSFLDQKKDCKLFCVGDDWQSIYRFTGSDVHIFTEFEKHFGYSKISTIEQCYRFPQKLLDISSDFVMKNSSQMPKHLITKNKDDSIIEIKFLDNNSLFKKESVYSIRNEIETVAEANKGKEIYVLCRYNLDIARLSRNFDTQNIKEDLTRQIEFMSAKNNDISIIKQEEENTNELGHQFPNNVEFLTAHKSKGKERDIVYIIISTKGVYGFPSLIADDPILDMFLAHKDEIDYAEERRLFYVAITRAKERICIITSKENMSPFVHEIINSYGDKISVSDLSTKFYAYFIDKENYNIVNTWEECKQFVEGKNPSPQNKRFDTEKEARERINGLLSGNSVTSEIKKNVKKKYFAYYINDNETGIVDNWGDCEEKIKGVSGVRQKSFETYESAKLRLESGAHYDTKLQVTTKGIYFDAGTGGGGKTRISVTDEKGNNLLDKAIKKELLDQDGKMTIEKTNNYGELLACKYAIQIAENMNIKNIFGDSKNAIDYWSKGICKIQDNETNSLSKEVTELRKKFESIGGEIKWISGGNNPADLGFHKG